MGPVIAKWSANQVVQLSLCGALILPWFITRPSLVERGGVEGH